MNRKKLERRGRKLNPRTTNDRSMETNKLTSTKQQLNIGRPGAEQN